MRCLWITRQDPRPANSGEIIYSKGLLYSLAKVAGLEITVLTYQPPDTNSPQDSPENIHWEIAGPLPRRTAKHLLSSLPSDAARLGERVIQEPLSRLLAQKWDFLIVDQAACAWVLDWPTPLPPLIYLSHNHEAAIRPEIAAESSKPWPIKWIYQRDAARYARLEKRLLTEAALVTAITREDADEFRALVPDLETLVLMPGYRQEALTPPTPADLSQRPRKVVLTGAFQWVAKARNLEEFLSAADGPFQAAKVSLSVVGKVDDPGYFERLGRDYPWAEFHPNVPAVAPFLRDSRMGVLPDTLGGGFKLKALDYIFNGLPLAAVSSSLRGLPPEVCADVVKGDSHPELVEAIVASIDETETLSAAAHSNLSTLAGRFSWDDRGQQLANKMRKL
ncbi:MAG: glycosyltransferase [Verrucomicrobiota bacterium JB023]|nr:glycosyltransferase [Verrucomicrobiota bacterium JB023]